MKELTRRLNAFPNSYFGFVVGVTKYAEKSPERLAKVLAFLDSSDEITTSDVVEFLLDQPDIYEDAVEFEEKVS